jgi:methyl-accepting chemotaxis protein
LVKLSTKILLTGVLIEAMFGAVFGWLFPMIRTAAYDAKYEKTQHLVQTAWSVADHFGKLSASGSMTTPQAQKAAKEALKAMRYGENDYFWINDQQPRMVMHPTNPALDGTDLSKYQDPKGTQLFVEMVDLCRRFGEGRLRYMWAKPGFTEPVPKVSYVKAYRAWGWIIGSGIYVDDVEAELSHLSNILLISSFLACAIGLGFAWFMARTVSRPVHLITDDLLLGAEHVSAAAAQVSEASQSQAQGTSEQSSAVEQTSVSLEQLTETVRRNADEAREVTRIGADVSRSVSEAGARMVETRKSIEEISRSGEEVKKIVKSIDEIAFQTNILALNAAVEAARAGAAGAGFAVVADEVRNLAQRAAQAAQNTAEKIGDSVAKSERGVAVSAELARSFDDIAHLIAGVNLRLAAIADSTAAQTTGVDKIRDAMRQINQVTQASASGSEETAAAAEELQAQAATMRHRMKELMAVIEGADASREAVK